MNRWTHATLDGESLAAGDEIVGLVSSTGAVR